MVVCKRQEYWRYEQVGCPPAVGTRSISWTGELVSAVLHVELEEWTLYAIELNGNVVWRGNPTNTVDVDVTEFLIKGANTLALWYNAPWCAPWYTRACYAYIDVCSTGTVEVEVPTPTEWWQEVAKWGLIAVVGVVTVKTILDYILYGRKRGFTR